MLGFGLEFLSLRSQRLCRNLFLLKNYFVQDQFTLIGLLDSYKTVSIFLYQSKPDSVQLPHLKALF